MRPRARRLREVLHGEPGEVAQALDQLDPIVSTMRSRSVAGPGLVRLGRPAGLEITAGGSDERLPDCAAEGLALRDFAQQTDVVLILVIDDVTHEAIRRARGASATLRWWLGLLTDGCHATRMRGGGV